MWDWRPLASGVALWFAFPQYALFPLAWIGLIPYLDFLTEPRPVKSLLAGHFLLGGLYFAGVLYWIPGVLVRYGGLSWLVSLLVFSLLVLALALFLLPFSLLTGWTAGKSVSLALACAPGFWILTELLRNYWAANGFPWGALGYSQYPFAWFRQLADLGGIYLLSYLVVAGNCALLSLLRLRRARYAAGVAAVLAAGLLYGFYRIHLWSPETGASLRVALVQGNVALAETQEYYATRYFEDLPRAFQEAVQKGARWVIFPEAQNPYFYPDDFYFRTFWQRRVRQAGAYLLFNATSGDTQGRYYNSVFLLDPSGEPSFRSAKVELVPFGEYIPLKDWLSFAEPLVREVSDFSPGAKLEVGQVEGIPFGVLVCYESIFPELSRTLSREGAEILVNVTNDTWFGDTAAPVQHLQIAAFRSIENRKPMLRAANSGISAVISPWGDVQQSLPLFRQDTLIAPVAGSRTRSPYSCVGEWLNIALIIGSLGIALTGKGPTFSKRR